jgi:hypothetical protein
METVMGMSLEATARAMRAAMRETVKRYSLWHLIFKGLLWSSEALANMPLAMQADRQAR